jgi:hypothetical protein
MKCLVTLLTIARASDHIGSLHQMKRRKLPTQMSTSKTKARATAKCQPSLVCSTRPWLIF